MINPDFELDRLRWHLQDREWLSQEIDEIVYAASDEINNVILDVISNASATAITHAEEIGAEDFISDINIVQEGSIYLIGTRSGRTDYSVAKVENLPNLLKNGKLAADGSIYRVIPIKEKTNKIPTSSFQVMKSRQEQIQKTRETIIQNNKASRSDRANIMADQFRQNLSKTLVPRKSNTSEVGGTTSFRTASSKQNPETSWVIPEKDRDMTQYLIDLNDRIKETIEESVLTIINFYMQEYS